MNSIRIENPWLLFIIIPLVAAIIVGFFLLPKQKRTRPKNLISLGLHIAMSVLLGLAFADIQYLTSSTDTELYVVCDVSDSVKNDTEKIDDLIQDIKDNTTGSAKVGVVAFGKDQYELVRPGSGLKSVSEMYDEKKHSDFDNSASDIASALTYTSTLFSKDSIKRIVLISDGLETDSSAIDTVDTLLSDSIAIDCISVSTTTNDEVAITALDYTPYCFVGRDVNVKVLIQSTKQKKLTINLTSGGSILSSQDITVSRGLNTVSIPLDSSKVGTFDYEVTIDGASDTYTDNNKKGLTIEYTDDFNVLFVADTQEEYNAFKELNMYSENSTIKTYIDDIDNVPYTIDKLLAYDEIVFSGIDITNFGDNAEELVNSLTSYVKVYGKSFMTYGETYSTGSQDYISAYNDLLPVQYQSEGGMALAIIIDVSGSMSSDNRITKAKQGAIKCLDLLSEKDYVSIITFGSETKVVQSLISAKMKTKVASEINKISANGGTKMSPALQEAYKQLKSSKAENKHVILLSDGEPESSDKTSCTRWVKMLASNNIISTFINISNNSSTAVAFLKGLATSGFGTYYYVRNSASLINVMVTSVSEDVKNKRIEESSDITIAAAKDPSVKDITSFVEISGYNYCRIKPAATTVLTVTYTTTINTDEETTTEDSSSSTSSGQGSNTAIANVPLYAHWTYGKGKVGSFTSNLDDWTSSFRSSLNGKLFLKQAATDLLPDNATDSILDMAYTNNGYTTDVTVSPNDGNTTGKITVEVSSPSNKKETYQLYYDGNGYSGTISTPEIGKYEVHVKYEKHSDPEDDTSSFVTSEEEDLPLYFDYSKEYDVNAESNNLLYRIAARADGHYGADDASSIKKLTNAQMAVVNYNSTMFFFLIAAIVVFLADIFVRKSEFKKKKKAPAATVNPFGA